MGRRLWGGGISSTISILLGYEWVGNLHEIGLLKNFLSEPLDQIEAVLDYQVYLKPV